MDVLLLLAEESKYADRVRDDIVRKEINRQPLLISGRFKKYRRPKSRTTTPMRTPISSTRRSITEIVRSKREDTKRTQSVRTPVISDEEYSNSPIDTSRRVDKDEVLYVKEDVGIKYTIEDLILASRGLKKISVRELRPIANRWGIDSSLKKTDLLMHIIAQYRRRVSSRRRDIPE